MSLPLSDHCMMISEWCNSCGVVEMKYSSQHCCHRTIAEKMALKSQMLFGELYKIMVNKFTFVGFSSDSATRVNDSTRVWIFGYSDSTRFTFRKMATRLEWRFSQNDSTRVTIDHSSQSHFHKILELLMDKPSSFALKEMSSFARLTQIFCFASLVVLCYILRIKCPQLAQRYTWDFAFTEESARNNTLTPYRGLI